MKFLCAALNNINLMYHFICSYAALLYTLYSLYLYTLLLILSTLHTYTYTYTLFTLYTILTYTHCCMILHHITQYNASQAAQEQFTRWHSGCTEGLKRRRFTESQLFSSCAATFGCTSSACSVSLNYKGCASTCQYCTQCGGCSGSTYSKATCTN
jgi:hypothetical protein